MSRDDSRAAIEAAFDQWEQEQAETEDISVEAEEEETENAVEEEGEHVEDDEASAEGESEADDAEDELQVPTGLSEESEEDVDDDSEPEDVAQATPAPNSWRATAREVWADIPEAARAEIEKREAEHAKFRGEVSEKTGLANRFEQAIEPFKQTIAIEAGGDPIEATRNLMGFATRLRGGTAHEKAVAVADIIRQYGVDIDTLDSALVGDANPSTSVASHHPTSAPPPAADPRVEQMWQQQMANQQQTQQRVHQETQAFLDDPVNEFANDVRADMADLMALSAQRGQEITLKEAYDKAVQMRPDIQGILQQRRNVGAQQQTNPESLKRKKRASKSVKGSPSGADTGPKQPTDRRGAILASWNALERQTQ